MSNIGERLCGPRGGKSKGRTAAHESEGSEFGRGRRMDDEGANKREEKESLGKKS